MIPLFPGAVANLRTVWIVSLLITSVYEEGSLGVLALNNHCSSVRASRETGQLT
jgi:hypothetical protein